MSKIKKIIKSVIMLFKTEKKVAVPQLINSTEILKDKIALITGGSGGIGMEIARSFLKSGAKVIIAGTKEEKLKLSCEKLKSDSLEQIKYIVLNALDVQAMPEKILTAAELFDENRIDILVNAAGIISNSSFLKMSEKEYDDVMNINAKGTYFMSQAVAKLMINKKIKGHILNLSSASALRPAWSPYHISKWAIKGMTIGLADELLPYGIVVNAIAPGPVATPMLGKQEGDSIYNAANPSGRYAMPSEIAALATFMVSDMGNLIVGDTFYITGGGGTISLHN